MSKTEQSILVVAAHPDDEVLGCGGTISRMTGEGAIVRVAFLSDGIGARDTQVTPDPVALHERRQAAAQACAVLGVESPLFYDLPDNKLDAIPLLDIVRKVESLLDVYQPDTVFTHHAGDLNIDHRRVHEAVATACRPYPLQRVRQLLFFEVPSSTDWQPPSTNAVFSPNVFIDISKSLDKKLEALQAYTTELRPWPHSRSLEAVEYLARWRGASGGMVAAEVFMLGRELR